MAHVYHARAARRRAETRTKPRRSLRFDPARYHAAMLVRAARAEDFAALAAITNHYIATSSIHFGYEPVGADELRAQWQASDRYPWLVAARDGEVIGYAKAGVWRARTAYQWTTEVG